jgi:hypothetical protein
VCKQHLDFLDRILSCSEKHSPLAAKITDEFMKTLREVGGWQKIAKIAYSNQRNRILGI